MEPERLYPPEFYTEGADYTGFAARRVISILLELLTPRSVVDVGCGTGVWLAQFALFGVSDIWGVDGPHVRADELVIDPARFSSADLEQPLQVGREFDCAVSLEVAEHLSPVAAEPFVDSLTRLAPVVLFSAAIPFQGGIHHVNEQWQQYWANLFASRGYIPIDAIRPRLWDDERVLWYTRQNTLLYVRRDHLVAHPRLKEEYHRTRDNLLSIVLPNYYLRAADPRFRGLREVAALLPQVFAAAVKRRWDRLRGDPPDRKQVGWSTDCRRS